MSLAIKIDQIKAVLIGNKWYPVDNKSFNLDSYEFMEGKEVIHGGGKSGVCATGFEFTSNGQTFYGPLTAVQAVRYEAK